MTTLPYSISINEQDGFFYFVTDNKLIYKCYFESALTLIPILGIYDIEAYEFGFYCFSIDGNEKYKPDRRIGATVVQLIKDFFSNPRRVLLYICDYSDERGNIRQLLFERWFKRYSDENIKRTQLDIQKVEGNTSYKLQGCILYKNDFPEKEALQTYLIDKAGNIAFGKYSI